MLRFRHTCCARCYTTRKTGVTEIVHKPCPFLRAIGRSAAFCLSQSKRLCAENGSNKTSLEKPTCHTLPEVFSVGPLRQRSRGGNCPQASPSFFFLSKKRKQGSEFCPRAAAALGVPHSPVSNLAGSKGPRARRTAQFCWGGKWGVWGEGCFAEAQTGSTAV